MSVAEQVAIIYAGIKGYLDELEVSEVKTFSARLLSQLNTQKTYLESVNGTGQFPEEAENGLKDVISATLSTLTSSK